MRLLAAMLPGPKEATLSSVQGPDCRVLFTRYERIGDMIMATSLIRNIALSLPSGRVDVLATSKNAPVLEGNPYVGKVLMLERGSIKSYREVMKQIRRERYTVMVDGRINNPPIFTSTPLLMYAGRVQFRVGAGGDNTARIYNVPVPAWDRVEHYIDGSKQLAVPFGVNPTSVDWQPEIFLSPEEIAAAEEKWNGARSLISRGGDASTSAGKRLLVNLSASEPKRRWPDGKFIATLQSARARFPAMPMIVMGLPNEWESVQEVANAVQALPAETPQLRDALRSGRDRRHGVHTRHEHFARGVGVSEAVAGSSQAGTQSLCPVQYVRERSSTGTTTKSSSYRTRRSPRLSTRC